MEEVVGDEEVDDGSNEDWMENVDDDVVRRASVGMWYGIWN